MKQILFCGWNGFGQMRNGPVIIDRPTLMPLSGLISSLSCSWSLVSAIKGGKVEVMGFIEGKSHGHERLVCFPSNMHLKQVSSCTNSTLICSEEGTCWRYAADTNSLIQIVDFVTTESNGIEVAEEAKRDKLAKVCCSDYVNLALSCSGRVFSIPTCISLHGIRAVDIACGNEHCILLSDQGLVYSWGSGSRGQLGHAELEPEEEPRLVSALQDLVVTSVSCGAWHCAVVTSSGDLYTWGWDCRGQLGRASSQSALSARPDIPSVCAECHQEDGPGARGCPLEDEGPVQSVPVPVDTPCDVKAVSCGARHTVVLLEDGSVWGCGWNSYGQLGIPLGECKKSPALRKITLPLQNPQQRVTGIVCGGWSTCFIVD